MSQESHRSLGKWEKNTVNICMCLLAVREVFCLAVWCTDTMFLMSWVLAQRVNAWERKSLVSQFHFTPLPLQKPDFSENNTCLPPIEPYSLGKNDSHTTASVKPKYFCIRLWVFACCEESLFLELFLTEAKWDISLLIISTYGQKRSQMQHCGPCRSCLVWHLYG